MTTKIADDAAAIKARMEEIQAERMQHLQGTPIEPPVDIDWSKWNTLSFDAPD